MKTVIAQPTGAEGYWTIQVVNRDRNQGGNRYACRAHDDSEAKAIAGHLAGSSRGVVGYDYHRIDNPHGAFERALQVGQSERIEDADTWAALQASRRIVRA